MNLVQLNGDTQSIQYCTIYNLNGSQSVWRFIMYIGMIIQFISLHSASLKTTDIIFFSWFWIEWGSFLNWKFLFNTLFDFAMPDNFCRFLTSIIIIIIMDFVRISWYQLSAFNYVIFFLLMIFGLILLVAEQQLFSFSRDIRSPNYL